MLLAVVFSSCFTVLITLLSAFYALSEAISYATKAVSSLVPYFSASYNANFAGRPEGLL